LIDFLFILEILVAFPYNITSRWLNKSFMRKYSYCFFM